MFPSPETTRARRRRPILPVVLAAVLAVLAGCSPSVFDLAVGDCLMDPGLDQESAEIDQVDTVDCAEELGLEAMLSVDHDAARGTDYPGDDQLHDTIGKECEKAFPAYVGIAYEESGYWISTVVPSPDSWGFGDRELLCLLGPETGTTTGAARDSGR